eukprot:Colp12_sorted_trinity150504_noHs@31453
MENKKNEMQNRAKIKNLSCCKTTILVKNLKRWEKDRTPDTRVIANRRTEIVGFGSYTHDTVPYICTLTTVELLVVVTFVALLWHALGLSLGLVLFPLKTRNDVVDAEKHNCRLNGRLKCLDLDRVGIPHTELVHVNNSALVAIDTPVHVAGSRVLGAESSEGADDVSTAVFDKGAGDDLKSISNSPVGPLAHTLDTLSLLTKVSRNSHFSGTTTGEETGINHNVAGHVHGILKVALDLHEHILGGTTQKDGAGLGLLALGDESEVVVANLLDFEETSTGTDIRLLELLSAVDNSGTACTGNAVVISLANAAKSSNIVLDEVVLGKIGQALLGNDKVGLELNDVLAHSFNLLFLELKKTPSALPW